MDRGAKAKRGPIVFARGPLPWLIPGLVAGAAIPVVNLVVRAALHRLGANPIAEALNALGLFALVYLLASLACTPLKIAFGWTWPIRIRKTLGLLAFTFASLHFALYLFVDQGFSLFAIAADMAKHPFIVVGLSAFALLVPLALTSTAASLKRLGFARWKLLHRLVYVAAILAVIHFVLRVKKDVREPAIYAAVLAILLAARLFEDKRRSSAGARKTPGAHET